MEICRDERMKWLLDGLACPVTRALEERDQLPVPVKGPNVINSDPIAQVYLPGFNRQDRKSVV